MGRTIEIDEVELQRSNEARKFVEAIWNNPKARRKLLEAQKEVKPDDPLVKELEKPDPLEERFAELTKANSDLRAQIEKDKAEREQSEKLEALKRTWDSEVSSLVREHGYTPEGIKALEKIRDERGIMSANDCSAIWERANPPQNPISPTSAGSGWNFMEPQEGDADDLKKLIDSKGENNALIDKMAHEALRDARGVLNNRR